jgi:hypothetical protein
MRYKLSQLRNVCVEPHPQHAHLKVWWCVSGFLEEEVSDGAQGVVPCPHQSVQGECFHSKFFHNNHPISQLGELNFRNRIKSRFTNPLINKQD